MTTSLDRTGVGAHEHAVAASARPVLLATLDAPLLPEASRMAVDSAVESGKNNEKPGPHELLITAAPSSTALTKASAMARPD